MKNLSRNIAILLSLLFVVVFVYLFQDIVKYVLIAWVISMIGQPMVTWLSTKVQIRNFKLSRTIAAQITLILFVLVFVGLAAIFIPLIVQQTRNLVELDYNQIGATLNDPINQLYDLAAQYHITLPKSPNQFLQDTFGNYFSPKVITDFFSGLISFTGSFMIGVFSILFISFFFLKEEFLFTNFIIAIVPDHYENQAKGVLSDSAHMLSRYFGGLVLQVSTITFIMWIALSIIGIQNALLIAFFAALINLIPYVGPIIGASFAVFITITSNLDLDFYTQLYPLLLKVVISFGLMQLIDNFVLQPYIFSNSVSAHPLEIFIIILMGAQLNGVVGMILAIPAYTVFRVFAFNFLSEFRIVQTLTRNLKN